MKRRVFINHLLKSAFIILSSQPAISWAQESPSLEISIKNLPPNGQIASLGRQYLSHHPLEHNAETLLNIPSINQLKLIESWLTQQIQEDFEQGNTERIDGWLYAKTELKLCALYHIYS